ncbi:hypothetical protein H7X69_02555 [Candidatus Saccharibacteria bacterium]|nr:hypothetical protein [Candidatus Saccharibacteria bacterium]
MSLAAEILVIILSIFLALFLVLGIILTVYLIKLTHDIRALTNSAGRTVNTIGTAIAGASKLTSPLFIAQLVGRYFKKVSKSKKGGK